MDISNEEPKSYRNESFSFVSVLIIDDDFLLRQILKKMLNKLNITNIIEAIDGSSGLAVFKNDLKWQTPTIILLDMEMEPYDGLHFLKYFRDLFPDCKSKIIAVTSHTEKELLFEIMKYHVDRFTQKPLCLK